MSKKIPVFFALLAFVLPSLLSCSSDMSVVLRQKIDYNSIDCLTNELGLKKSSDNILLLESIISINQLNYKKTKSIMFADDGPNLYIFYTWKSKNTEEFLTKENLKLVKDDLKNTVDYISNTNCLTLKTWTCSDEVDNVVCNYIEN